MFPDPDPEVGARACTFDTSGCHLCGDNQAEGPEECDGTDLAGQSCLTLDFEGGTLACVACAFDTSGCDNCGDGVQEPPEECDGADFGTQTCVTRGFDGGSLLCTIGCMIDDTGCYVCGDNLAEGPEECDGTDHSDETCESLDFVGGDLGCIDCAFDTSGCHNCGNQTLDPPEQCDPPDYGGENCESQGYDGGEIGCTGSCTFDFSDCYDCGNDIIEGPEVCDGEALGGVTCQDLGYDYGELACLPGCDGYDVSGCFNDPSAEPRFTGKELEPDLDLYYFGARYLDAGVGRFTAPDPGPFALENPQTLNRYSYALNGPYRYNDPDGRVVDTILDVGFLAYDIYDIGRSVFRGEAVTGTQWAALGADALGAAVPFATGGGLAVRGTAKAAIHFSDDVATAALTAARRRGQLLANRGVGNAARNRIAARFAGAAKEQFFHTSRGARYIDVLTPAGKAIESKVGLTSFPVARMQALKDVELLRTGAVDSVEWVFTRSPTTGKIGPSKKLAAFLQKHDIPYRQE
jgi:RHS repeat-associated protein